NAVLRARKLEAVGRPEKVVKSKFETQSMCLAVPRAVFEAVGGFDPGYRGWGGEDNAFWHSASIVSGEPHRAPGAVYHLWHPPANEKRNERWRDSNYRRNWDRWCAFKETKSIEEIRTFRRYE